MALALLLMAASCSDDKSAPSHAAKIHLQAEGHGEFLQNLDRGLADKGFKRVGAAPGLNELKGRPVLFAAYVRNPQRPRIVMDATDVKVANEIEIRFYKSEIADQAMREEVLIIVNGLIEKYGAYLKPVISN